MTKRNKVVARLLTRPSDFSWSELVQVMDTLGFDLRTSVGSGRKFIHRQSRETHFIPEPHPSKILKRYQVRDLLSFLRETGHIA